MTTEATEIPGDESVDPRKAERISPQYAQRLQQAKDREGLRKQISTERGAERAAVREVKPSPHKVKPLSPTRILPGSSAETLWVCQDLSDDEFAMIDIGDFWRLHADPRVRAGDFIRCWNITRTRMATLAIVKHEPQTQQVQVRLIETHDLAPIEGQEGTSIQGYRTVRVGGIRPWAIENANGTLRFERFDHEHDAISAIVTIAPKKIA